MPSFKVAIRSQANDCFVEVWKVIGEKKYFARYVCGLPVWYFVCDPMGYCELDHACPDDYVFEVCDQDGNVLFKDSNGVENRAPFVTLEGKTRQVWASIQDEYETRDGLNDWLLSYMTPENLAKDPSRTQFCPEDNWVAFWYDRVGHEIVHEYDHLGTKYCIYAITCKHLFCDCTWVEYMAGEANMDWEYPFFIKYFGSQFDDTHGPMYSKRKACEYVMDALKQMHGEVVGMSYVSRDLGGNYHERRLCLYDAAAYLIGKDLSRDHVHAVVEAERKHNTLYANFDAILADYPDCKRDFSMNWWW